MVFQPARLIYQRVNPSDTTKLGFLPGIGACFLPKHPLQVGKLEDLREGMGGHENPNEFSRSFEVVF